MKRICLFLTCIIMFAYTPLAHGFIGLCCGKCGGNMPMNIMGGGVPERHEFRFKLSPTYMSMEGLVDGTGEVDGDDLLGMPVMMGVPTGKFMAVPTRMDMYMVNAAVGYSFTDDFFGGLMFMWKSGRMEMKFNDMMRMDTGKEGFLMESEGMGDTMIMTKYRLYADDPFVPTSQVSFFSGLSLPTGSINERNSNHPVAGRSEELLPYAMQLGSGTFDPMAGLLYQGSGSPWWWGANLTYVERFYNNSKDWRLGDELRLDLYAMYQVRYDLVAEVQLGAGHREEIGGETTESRTGASGHATEGDPLSPFSTPLWDPDNYGAVEVTTAVGVQWQPYPLHILDVTFGVTVYQDSNGPQMEEDYRVMFTWYMELPTSASKRYMGGEEEGKSRLGF